MNLINFSQKVVLNKYKSKGVMYVIENQNKILDEIIVLAFKLAKKVHTPMYKAAVKEYEGAI